MAHLPTPMEESPISPMSSPPSLSQLNFISGVPNPPSQSNSAASSSDPTCCSMNPPCGRAPPRRMGQTDPETRISRPPARRHTRDLPHCPPHRVKPQFPKHAGQMHSPRQRNPAHSYNSCSTFWRTNAIPQETRRQGAMAHIYPCTSPR